MQQRNTPIDDIEIDLGRYIRPLFARWKLIISTIVSLALAGLGLSYVAPANYEAVASVAIVKTRTDVQFDARIRTLQPDDAGATVNDTRRNALIGLVANTGIAARAVQLFSDRLQKDERDPASVLLLVKGDSVARGDLILIKVQHQDAALAADLATFWAREYETLANGLYAGTSPEYLQLIRTEMDRARTDMDATQKSLTDFLGTNDIDALRLRIAAQARVLDSLEASQLAPSLSALQRAQGALAAVGTITESKLRVRQLRTLAATMRDQVRSGGESAAATNVIPLINLKMQIYAVVGSRSNTREDLENTTSTSEKLAASQGDTQLRATGSTRVDISSGQAPVLQVMLNQPTVPISVELQIKDLDAIVTSLDKLEGELSTALQTAQRDASEVVAAPVAENQEAATASLTALGDLRSARAELERQEQQRLRLQESRDLAVNAFRSLSAKLAEVEVSNAVANREVRLASAAVPPVERVTGRIVPVGAGAGVGLALGLMLALIAAARAGEFRKPTLS
jgi:Chain length determinant protein